MSEVQPLLSYQFSVRRILWWTTLVCFGFAAHRLLPFSRFVTDPLIFAIAGALEVIQAIAKRRREIRNDPSLPSEIPKTLD